jgi:hypothetical protein
MDIDGRRYGVPRGRLATKSPSGAADFKYPKQITNEDFVHICKTCKISASDQQDLRRWFDTLVKELADWMCDDRKQPGRGGDRGHIKKAREYVTKAAVCINRLSPMGRGALPVLDALKEALPVLDALKEVERGFTQALEALDCQPGARGGRKKYLYRDYLIINLALKWADHLGKKILTGPRSEFVTFCESVADAIGWPTDGISEAIRPRNLTIVHLSQPARGRKRARCCDSQ